jgi:hypothetical protein
LIIPAKSERLFVYLFLQHLDLDIAASIAWQVLDSGLNPEQVAATLLADDIKNQYG